jgi:ribokinase
MVRVVVVGSSNTDMTVRLARLPVPGETRLGGAFATSPGGKGANQAVAARRAGAEVAFLTAVGDDALGRQALDHYRREGLDISHARIIPGAASGVALIFVEDGGENMIGVAPGANALLTPGNIDDLPEPFFAQGGVFLTSLEIPLATVVRGLRRARDRGMTTVLNPAPIDPAILDPDIVPLIDILTPNREEARALAGVLSPGLDLTRAVDAARRLRSGGFRTVIVTLGSDGCLLAHEGSCLVIPAFRVEEIDTVGAGDAFNGALAVALAEGNSLPAAAAWACAAGAHAVTRPGAQSASPHRAEIDDLADRGPTHQSV